VTLGANWTFFAGSGVGAAAEGKGGLGCSILEPGDRFGSGVDGLGGVVSGASGLDSGVPSVPGESAGAGVDEAFLSEEVDDFLEVAGFDVLLGLGFELFFEVPFEVLLFFLVFDDPELEDLVELFFFVSAADPGSRVPPSTNPAQKIAMTAFLKKGGSDGLTPWASDQRG
jgi:hypothetical protein